MEEEWDIYCEDCKCRPGITEDGTFFCPWVSEIVHDKNEPCEYFEQWKIRRKKE